MVSSIFIGTWHSVAGYLVYLYTRWLYPCVRKPLTSSRHIFQAHRLPEARHGKRSKHQNDWQAPSL